MLVLGIAALAAGCAGTRGHGLVTPPVAAPSLVVSPASAPVRRGDEPLAKMRLLSRHRTEERPHRRTFHRDGIIFHHQVSYSEVRGSLEGTTAVVDDTAMPTQFLFLPDVDASAGASFLVGLRMSAWEVLLGYGRTDYDASFGGVDMETRMTYLDLLFRRYFLVESRFQPYVVGGFGWSEATIENGALDNSNLPGVFSDGKLNDGVTLNLGAGASLYLTPWLSVYVQGLYRYGEHQSVTGPFGRSLTEHDIDSDTWEVAGGLSVRVLPLRE